MGLRGPKTHYDLQSGMISVTNHHQPGIYEPAPGGGWHRYGDKYEPGPKLRAVLAEAETRAVSVVCSANTSQGFRAHVAGLNT